MSGKERFDIESMEEVLPTLDQVVGQNEAFKIFRDTWIPLLIAEVKSLQVEMDETDAAYAKDLREMDSKIERLRVELENCYLLARRMLYRIGHGIVPMTQHGEEVSTENWAHIARFCERAGLTASMLREDVAQQEEEIL